MDQKGKEIEFFQIFVLSISFKSLSSLFYFYFAPNLTGLDYSVSFSFFTCGSSSGLSFLTSSLAETVTSLSSLSFFIISGVSYSNDQNKILKTYPIPNNSEVSLTGLVLEQWQNLYVSASAGVAFNFIGFEETVTIT